MRPYSKAVLQLFLASILWGGGFVASVWSIHLYNPIEVVIYRFFLSSIFGFLILFFISKKNLPILHRQDLLRSLPAGFLLGTMQLTQTIGLQTTTASKSSFITSLYVLLVPLLSSFFFRKTYHFRFYLLVLLSILGTALLVDLSFTQVNVGDVWTFVCAVMAALHIIYIGYISKKLTHEFRFNVYQSMWSCIFIVPLLFYSGENHFFIYDEKSVLGLLYLCIGSSLIAFYLQIKAQKILSNTTVTMISLLEAPVAALCGYLILNELLLAGQLLGAFLILLSSALCVFVIKD